MFASLAVFILLTGTSPAQTVSVVHSFNGTNGEYPQNVVLVQGRDGGLYATAELGGASGLGTIFKQRATGNGNVVLYNFSGPDGSSPTGGLMLASDGNYYGGAATGGSAGQGVLFRVTSRGGLTVLHSFSGVD